MCSFTGFQSLSGSNLRAFHLTNELIRRGNDVSFLTPGSKAAQSCRDRFSVNASDVGIEISRFKKSKFKLYPIFAWKARKRIPKDADIVFGQSLPAALAVRLSKTKGRRVIDYVDLWSEYWKYEHNNMKGRITYPMMRWAEGYSMKKQDIVFTITRKIAQMLRERGCKGDKIRVMRDGVDTKMFHPKSVGKGFYSKYGLEKETYIVYQGGIGIWDGVQFLVDAASAVIKDNPTVKFLIVGDGPYAPTVRKLVKNKGLEKNFIFTGWVPYNDMPDFMNISKINIVPIPDAPCTQGVVTLKLFEAMACGIPTIIGDLPGVKEHMTHRKTAYLTRSENAESLSSAINEVLSDRGLYKRMKNNGLRMSPHYDWREIAKEMADIML